MFNNHTQKKSTFLTSSCFLRLFVGPLLPSRSSLVDAVLARLEGVEGGERGLAQPGGPEGGGEERLLVSAGR